jgi:hypothetical protein
MPVQTSQDSQGCFARWGTKGKKYYYECGNEEALKNAKKKATAQGVAIGDYFKKLDIQVMPGAKIGPNPGQTSGPSKIGEGATATPNVKKVNFKRG